MTIFVEEMSTYEKYKWDILDTILIYGREARRTKMQQILERQRFGSFFSLKLPNTEEKDLAIVVSDDGQKDKAVELSTVL